MLLLFRAVYGKNRVDIANPIMRLDIIGNSDQFYLLVCIEVTASK